MIARTITVNRQTCNGDTTTPRGRTRRVVPMTSALYDVLRRMETIEGYVARNLDGTPKPDGETDHVIARICRAPGCRSATGTHVLDRGIEDPDRRILAMLGAVAKPWQRPRCCERSRKGISRLIGSGGGFRILSVHQ